MTEVGFVIPSLSLCHSSLPEVEKNLVVWLWVDVVAMMTGARINFQTLRIETDLQSYEQLPERR